jgi:predicted restriction endonuclease
MKNINKILVYLLFVPLGIATTIIACKYVTPNHACVDKAHVICDGECECDGLSCPKPVITVIPMYQNKEGRLLFTVKTDNGQVFTHMYAEEIAKALITGDFDAPNEDLRLFPAYQYQVTLDPDNIVITDFDRHVASVPYSKIGLLDSIFIKDNE